MIKSLTIALFHGAVLVAATHPLHGHYRDVATSHHVFEIDEDGYVVTNWRLKVKLSAKGLPNPYPALVEVKDKLRRYHPEGPYRATGKLLIDRCSFPLSIEVTPVDLLSASNKLKIAAFRSPGYAIRDYEFPCLRDLGNTSDLSIFEMVE